MPTHGFQDSGVAIARRREAVRQVRAKFPDLVEGTSGWYRALNNRLRRI